MSHALGSMAANGLTNKAALPALEELLNQTFRHYGKVRSIEFRDGTLALGMKISGIREIVPVSVGTVIMSPDGRTLSFSDFASTVPAVARGLELLAVENGPVSVADGKTAAVRAAPAGSASSIHRKGGSDVCHPQGNHRTEVPHASLQPAA